MKVSKIVFAGVFTVASALGALAPVTATLASNNKDHKVTICHATNSATNPYVVNTVDYNSIVRKSGHDGHNGGVAVSVAHATELKNNKQMWGDIIPAIAKHNYAGKNLTTEGRTILANGCNFPTVVTPAPQEPTTPNKPSNPEKPEKPVQPNKPEKGNEKVTYCHATRSATNPYVRVRTSVNAVANKYGKTNGHGNHDDAIVATSYQKAQEIKQAGGRWGDVIPAIPSKGFAGLNLAEGQELLGNNCQVVNVKGDTTDNTKPETPADDTPNPVVDSDTNDGGKGDVKILESAYTDQPRVAALPITGGIGTLLIPVIGLLAAGVVYLAAPVLRRLGVIA